MSRALDLLRRGLDHAIAALTAGAALAMVAAFAAVALSVADRFFGLGLRGLDAYAGYAIAAALFLALPGALRRGEHIRVTLVLHRLPPRGRAWLEGACLAAGLALALALAVYACRLVIVSHATHDVSPAADATPLWLPQIAMALGCIGFAAAFAGAFVSHLVPRAAAQPAAPGAPARPADPPHAAPVHAE